MANPNAPFGLRPVRSLGKMNTAINEYYHQSSDATGLFIGDPVISSDQDSSSSGIAGIPDGSPIVTASGTITTTAIRGAVVGVRPTLTNLTLQYCAASVNLGILVSDDPFQVYEAQITGAGTLVVGDIGDNMGITSASGSTTTGISAYVLTQSTGHADNAYTMRVLRLAPIQGNLLGLNSIVECQANLHELLTTTPS